jgi:spore coat polysaccharide biosynthesis predicted glycosyltransferase SpsG
MIFEWPGNFMVDIIIGPLFKLEINSLSAALREKCSITCHESPSYIGKLFEDADLVFCGGGGTLLEAICVGVPVVVIAQN